MIKENRSFGELEGNKKLFVMKKTMVSVDFLISTVKKVKKSVLLFALFCGCHTTAMYSQTPINSANVPLLHLNELMSLKASRYNFSVGNVEVYGTISAKELKVTTTGGADFVFNDDYSLKPLSEVNDFIKEHKHLPEIPSAAEMVNDGVGVGEMQVKLLQKTE